MKKKSIPSLFSPALLRLLGASAIGFACMGAAHAQAPTILDELTIATLTPLEKDMLLNDVFNDLNKDDDDQQAHVWDNGSDKAHLVTVTYNFSNSGLTEHSLKAHACRDLKFIVTAGGKTQDLSRRTCTQDSGRWDVQGKDAAPVAYPPFLSDITVAKLNAKEKEALINAAETVLRDNEEGVASHWSNQGLGNPVPLKVSLAPSNTGAKPGSYHTCRDLTMILDGKGGTQTLQRRSCENRMHTYDIVPGHENGQ